MASNARPSGLCTVQRPLSAKSWFYTCFFDISKTLKKIIQKLNNLPTKTNFSQKVLNLMTSAGIFCPNLSFPSKLSLNQGTPGNFRQIFHRLRDFMEKLETTLDCFASPWNSTKLHHLTKCCYSSPRISPYIWDHNSKTKAQIKKLKTCCSQQ